MGNSQIEMVPLPSGLTVQMATVWLLGWKAPAVITQGERASGPEQRGEGLPRGSVPEPSLCLIVGGAEEYLAIRAEDQKSNREMEFHLGPDRLMGDDVPEPDNTVPRTGRRLGAGWVECHCRDWTGLIEWLSEWCGRVRREVPELGPPELVIGGQGDPAAGIDGELVDQALLRVPGLAEQLASLRVVNPKGESSKIRSALCSKDHGATISDIGRRLERPIEFDPGRRVRSVSELLSEDLAARLVVVADPSLMRQAEQNAPRSCPEIRSLPEWRAGILRAAPAASQWPGPRVVIDS